MWMMPEFVELKPHCLHLAYDVCMHGGDRDKHQMLWTSLPELQALPVSCDRSHQHRPWGQTPSGSFATASETECPVRFAAAAALAAGSLHILPSASDVTTASARTAAQTQPKVSKALVLIEEYHYQVTIPLPSACLPPVNEKNCLLRTLGPAPPGSRVLRVNSLSALDPVLTSFPRLPNLPLARLCPSRVACIELPCNSHVRPSLFSTLSICAGLCRIRPWRSLPGR